MTNLGEIKLYLENKVVIEINTKIRIREPTDKVTEEMVKKEVKKVIRPMFEVKENEGELPTPLKG